MGNAYPHTHTDKRPQARLRAAKGMNMELQAGYKAYTGYVFTQADADAYNRITLEIERERYPATKEFLKDQRHRIFCRTIGVTGF